MNDQRPITQDEVFEMFGDKLPMEAVALLWGGPGDQTIGQLRADLRALAARLKATPSLIERLRSEAVNWSATCGDLFGEAADEIERQRAAIEQIAAVCADNVPASCNHQLALDFVRQVATSALTAPKGEPRE